MEELRTLAPLVLGALHRKYRDFAACEDAVQEALLAASQQWPRDGVPADPRAWLIRVAAFKMQDRVRAESARLRREEGAPPPLAELTADRSDDTLELIFACCHPALSVASQVALTLRAIAGLTTAEIARAFLVPEATMAQRISRAKQTLAGADLSMPEAKELPARLTAAMHVVYLIFNEGYTDRRTDLAAEAIRLARLLPQSSGLLALMLLTDARRDARSGPDGELIPLDAQDRSKWNAAQIAEGLALVAEALPRHEAYAIQAAIAAIHDEAGRAEDTDWPQILALYEVLEASEPGPMVALNKAIAVAMVRGPAEGLALVDQLDAKLSHRIVAARAHLLEMLGDRDAARAAFTTAANRTTSTAERDYLLLKATTQSANARTLAGGK